MDLSRFSRRRLLAGLAGLALLVMVPVGIAIGSGGAPTSVPDAYTVTPLGTLNVSAPGVLGNDTDPETDPLTAVEVTPPSHATGWAGLASDGSFSYVSDGTIGTDSFTYHAQDDTPTAGNDTTVTITVDNRPVGPVRPEGMRWI